MTVPSTPEVSATPETPLPAPAPVPPPPTGPVTFPLGWLLDHAAPAIQYRAMIEVARGGPSISSQISSLPYSHRPALTLAMTQAADGTWPLMAGLAALVLIWSLAARGPVRSRICSPDGCRCSTTTSCATWESTDRAGRRLVEQRALDLLEHADVPVVAGVGPLEVHGHLPVVVLRVVDLEAGCVGIARPGRVVGHDRRRSRRSVEALRGGAGAGQEGAGLPSTREEGVSRESCWHVLSPRRR